MSLVKAMQTLNMQRFRLFKSAFQRLLIALNVVIVIVIMNSIISKFKLGFGIADESHAISMVKQRLLSTENSKPWPFSIVTYPFFKLAGQDIYLFRLYSFLFVVVIAFTVGSLILKVNRNRFPFEFRAMLAIIGFCAVIAIPTSFRYLLITPSYQWTILVSSTLIFTIWYVEITSTEFSRNKEISYDFLMSTFLLAMTMSRVSSGLLSFFMILFAKYLRGDSKRRLTCFIAFFVSEMVILVLSYPKSIQNTFDFAALVSKIDPSYLDLSAEVLDVLSPLVVLATGFFLPVQIKSYVTKIRRVKLADFRKKVHVKIALLGLFFFSVREMYVDVGLFSTCRLFIISTLFGLLVQVHVKRNIRAHIFLVAVLPISSQFGSNISASYLFTAQIISLFALIVMHFCFDDSKVLPKGSYLSLLSIIVIIAISVYSKSSYERENESVVRKIDPETSLWYSESRLQNIEHLRSDVLRNGDPEYSLVMDLSFWHPGVILYMNKIPMPFFIGDIRYEKTLKEQTSFVIEKNLAFIGDRKFGVILEDVTMDYDGRCLALQDFIDNVELRKYVKHHFKGQSFRHVSWFKSSKSDTNLYPRNIRYVELC